MRLERRPRPKLRPFIKTLWSSDAAARASAPARREHVLPGGEMHLAFRLCDVPVRLFRDTSDICGTTVGFAVVGGARDSFYAKDVSEPACSVGAVLRPGASLPLFGVPAGELSGRHAPLDDFWGNTAEAARGHLLEELHPEHRLNVLESLLAARLPKVRALHPAVAAALDQFSNAAVVGEVVRNSGYSHRRFIQLFLEAVGLTPKVYCRVQRFLRALKHVPAQPSASWVDVALAAGFADQSHFNREFVKFTGVTPGEYATKSPVHPLHMPVGRPPAASRQ